MAVIVIRIDRATADYALWSTVVDGIVAAGDRQSVSDVILESNRCRRRVLHPDLLDERSEWIPEDEQRYLSELYETAERGHHRRVSLLFDGADEFGSSWPEYVGAWDDDTIKIWLPRECSISRHQLAAYVARGEWRE